MDKVRLILTLITIAITVGPIVGVLLMYQNNLLGLLIPPEINEIADKLSSGGGSNEPMLEPVGEPQYDPASRTAIQVIRFTNTFPFDVTIKSMSGDVKCAVHGAHLGVVSLAEPVSVGVGETKALTVLITWTEAAIGHFQTKHAGEETVVVNLVGFTVDVKGIQFQMDQTMEIPNPVA